MMGTWCSLLSRYIRTGVSQIHPLEQADRDSFPVGKTFWHKIGFLQFHRLSRSSVGAMMVFSLVSTDSSKCVMGSNNPRSASHVAQGKIETEQDIRHSCRGRSR
jgi:hypothetical protein